MPVAAVSQTDSVHDEGQTPGRQRQKKVRLACQRCRDRRIKCDGDTPSCSKCALAGGLYASGCQRRTLADHVVVPCIDVDARKSGNTISRAFFTDAQARLEWLEDLVRTRLPDVDITAGPKKPDVASQNPPATPTTGEKRQHSIANGEDDVCSVSQKARRMALDLGLFSLNTNLSQARYLGSSSGSFFANLIPHGEHNEEAYGTPEPESDPDLAPDQPGPLRDPSSDALFATLREVLPFRADCNRMVKLFYNYYHADYPVLHQPSFASLIDALYSCKEAPTGCPLQHNGWPSSVPTFPYNGMNGNIDGRSTIAISVKAAATQLLFVLSIAADLQTRQKCFTADPSKFRSQAITLFQMTLADVSIPSIQSVVLFILQSFISPGEGGSLWVILHIALAYAIDLGLHRNLPASSRLTETAAQIRRRTFFCLYVLDRSISTAQGRPIGFQDDTLDLTMPSPISWTQTIDRHDQYLLTYSAVHFKWASHISAIKYQLYRFVTNLEQSETVAEVQSSLQARLDSWLEESTSVVKQLPEAVVCRFQTEVNIRYHCAVGLLYQPSQLAPRPNTSALHRCFNSARERVRLYWSVYDQHDLSLSWPRTHDIFLASATLLYCIWSSPEIRSSIAITEVVADLRLCSSLLTLG